MGRNTKMRKLKSIGIMSFARVMGMSGALLGAIFDVSFSARRAVCTKTVI